VRAVGRRTKKLIVAFHFQFANQAGWECDACRKAGLEARRRCGWLPVTAATPARVVWARKGAACESCPKSYVAARSVAWVEQFWVRKRLGEKGTAGLTARDVEAFLILERECAAEGRQGGGTDGV